MPEIFNTDQGSQFTDRDFVGLIREKLGVQLSMDGKGCWRDNVFIERFWRSLKSEEVYLSAYAAGSEAKTSIGRYITFYNSVRTHSRSTAARRTEILQIAPRSCGILS